MTVRGIYISILFVNLILEAQKFAHAAHDSIGQVRKYTGWNILEKPQLVVDILVKYLTTAQITYLIHILVTHQKSKI